MKKSVLVGSLLALVTGFSAPSHACEECQLRKDGTYLGQFTLLGNGTVRSWVRFEDGKPSSLGLTFSENALSGLKEVKDLPAQMPTMEYKLALPPEAKITGFDHISLDWNPIGHPPKDIYTKPHFDVHFYTMSAEARTKITATGKDIAVCEKKPGADYLPVGYIMPPETAVPHMGAHAIDSSAIELSGQPFTSTFIYGFYNGQMNFMEPMVALEYLQKKANFSSPIKVPQAYAKSGFYPTRYSISYDTTRQEYSIALDNLTWHEAKPIAAKVVAMKSSGQKPVRASTRPKTPLGSKPKSAVASR